MKKISLALLVCFSTMLFAGFNIKGIISDYTSKDVTIRKAEGVSYKNMAIVTTNKKGEFSYRMGEDFKGLMLISIDDTKQTILLLADGKDITFQTSIKSIGSPVFPPNTINSAFQLYIKDANKGNLNQILDYILGTYSEDDAYYKATKAEKERIANQSFNAQYLEQYPFLTIVLTM